MGEKRPFASVIIPTYNRAQLVGRAIRSVLNQTHQDFELIVIDDASTDITKDVIKGFKDSRIRYIRLKSNRGAYAARNIGLRVAKGEFVAFLDDDDEWLAEKLETQLRLFRSNPRVKLVHVSALDIFPNGEMLPRISVFKGHCYEKLLVQDDIITSSVIVYKECFDKVGYFEEELRLYGDWDMWIRLSKHYNFGLIKRPLVRTMIHQGSLQRSGVARDMRYREMVIKRHLDEIENLGLKNKVYSYHYYSMGVKYFLRHNVLNARKMFLKSLAQGPTLSAGVYFMLTFLPLGYYRRIRFAKRIVEKLLGRRLS